MGNFNPDDQKHNSADRLRDNELKTSRVIEQKSVFFQLKDNMSIGTINSQIGDAILIVDDDLLNRFALKTLLQLSNFDVLNRTVLVENGKLAVQEVQKRNLNTFKLILMDINMPLMDGFEATRLIVEHFDKKNYTLPTIIGLTGDQDQMTINQGFQSGMHKVLGKPIKKNQILQILKEINLV